MPIPLISKTTPKIKTNSKGYKSVIVKTFLNKKAKSTYNRIKKYIYGNKILDIGMGVGGISSYLKQKGFKVTGIDVEDYSLFEDFKPMIYDGFNIPFKKNDFDTAILVHVLHHCEDRFKVLKEALRVSKRVIFIEDTYRNKFEHLVVSINDCIGNFEFYQHKYLTVDKWLGYFDREKINIISSEEWSEFTYGFLYSRYIMFVLEKK